ncbi:hypothetical protein QW180_31020 [Vibrio sinaloensis]|nr:hypothetical protein [Vibrio sinaloensis]
MNICSSIGQKNIATEQITAELLESLNAKLSKNVPIHCWRRTLVCAQKKSKKTNWLSCTSWFEQQERKPIAIWFYTTASLLCFCLVW